MTDRADAPRMGFTYFRERALDAADFTLEELAEATGWSASSIKTYLSKQWKGLVERTRGKLRVRREFLRLSERQFLDHITQRRPIFQEYRRAFHDHLVTFEFLLPLTRETELRQALDALFYEDSIKQRLLEIGLAELELVLPRVGGEDDADFLSRLVSEAGKFGGYSISHVSGRFRADDLRSRSEAATLVASGSNYLVDETTAVVRFIVPCATGSGDFDDALHSLANLGTSTNLFTPMELETEVELIRKLFFALFAETVVRTIRGEDEIWLIEGGVHRRLYRWSRVCP